MDKTSLKWMLRSIRELIRQSRPAYKDYLGTETVTVESKLIASGVLVNGNSELNLADTTFAGFELGKAYLVTVDGETGEYTVQNLNGENALISFEITEGLSEETVPSDFWGVVYVNDTILSMSAGSYIGKNISVSTLPTTKTEKKYDIKKLDEALLPDKVTKNITTLFSRNKVLADKVQDTQTTANSAQTTANSAQTTANIAQTTANNAKTTANSAQTTANSAQTTANSAQYTADKAYTLAKAALPMVGGGSTVSVNLTARTNDTTSDQYDRIHVQVDAPESGSGNPQLLFFGKRMFGEYTSSKVELVGIYAIVLDSPSGKQFKMTIDDDTATLTDTSDNTSKKLATEDYVTEQLKTIPANTSDILEVHFTVTNSGLNTTWTADKTYAEIKNALEANKTVIGSNGSMQFGTVYSDSVAIYFTRVNSHGETFTVQISESNSISRFTRNIKSLFIENASVGQIAKIKTVDDNGAPTSWESANLPTKTSQLTNDSGYLTEHQSLADYAKKTEIPTVPTTDSELSATSTNPVQNKIIKAELDKKLESIPVDGTTIKLNDQGQLTLALSNANGVNF